MLVDDADGFAAAYVTQADSLLRAVLAGADPEVRERAGQGVLRLVLSLTTPADWQCWALSGEVQMLAKRQPQARVTDMERKLFGASRALLKCLTARMIISQRAWLCSKLEPLEGPPELRQPAVVLQTDIACSAWGLTCSCRFNTPGDRAASFLRRLAAAEAGQGEGEGGSVKTPGEGSA